MNKAGILSTKRDREHHYSSPGTYHLFLETEDEAEVFGRVRRGVMTLNAFGDIFLAALAMALHRFAGVRIRAMDIEPHRVEVVVVLSGWRKVLRVFTDKVKEKLHKRRTMTIPLFVGFVKMNSAVRINGLRGVSGVAVWTRRYKCRVMTDEEEIAGLCAELDARFARVRYPAKQAPDAGPVVSFTSMMTSALGGVSLDGPALSGSIESPEQPFDTMLLGRMLFLSGSMLRPPPTEGGKESDEGVAEQAGRGGAATGPRIWSIGPGRIFLSGSQNKS